MAAFFSTLTFLFPVLILVLGLFSLIYGLVKKNKTLIIVGVISFVILILGFITLLIMLGGMDNGYNF